MSEFYSLQPSCVILDLTRKCNNSCRFCSFHDGVGPFLGVNHFHRILDAIAEASVSNVVFFGGEPTLHPQILDIAKEADDRGLKVRLVTNGSTMTPKLAKSLSRIFMSITVSLHGFRETHDYLTQVQGSYQKAMKALQLLTSLGMCRDVSFTLVKHNLAEVGDLARFLFSEYDVNWFAVNRLVNRPILEASVEELNVALSNLIHSLAPGYGESIRFSGTIPLCLVKPELHSICAPCSAGFQGGAIDEHGNLKMCPTANYVIGNVFETKLQELWHSEMLEAYRSLNWLDDRCASCELLSRCMGGCKVTDPSKPYAMDMAYREASQSNVLAC